MDGPPFNGIKCATVEVSSNHSNQLERPGWNITTIGLDLAKLFVQVHGVDAHGKACLRKQLKRAEVGKLATAHHWARRLTELGHTVKLMAPQFFKAYVKTNKNDPADAEAICEAVSRPNMRVVPVKNASQLSLLSLHRARQQE